MALEAVVEDEDGGCGEYHTRGGASQWGLDEELSDGCIWWWVSLAPTDNSVYSSMLLLLNKIISINCWIGILIFEYINSWR